jgi:dihydropyrimidinase
MLYQTANRFVTSIRCFLFVGLSVLLVSCDQISPQPTGILIKNGTVITSQGRQITDIRIRGEIIIELGELVPTKADTRVIDAKNMLVLPGGIDAHTHLKATTGFDVVDNYESATRAALAGGITTVGHMSAVFDPTVLPTQSLEQEIELINGQALSDMFVHSIIFFPSDEVVNDLQGLADAGQPSIKIFLPHQVGAPFPSPFNENEAAYRKVFEAAAAAGIRIAVHCEDADIIKSNIDRLTKAGNTTLAAYPDSRPIAAEVTAIEKVIELAESTGASIYIVHVSASESLQIIKRAQQTAAQDIFVESRPVYLHLEDSRYANADGPLFVTAPPIRSQHDQEQLWMALADGTVDTIASDHVPWTREQKMDPEQSFSEFRAGSNNLQVMLPMLFSEGVNGERISLERFVALTSTNPARIFGLYPTKGTIAVGSDADIVLWQADEIRTIKDEDMFSNAGFSIYDGTEVTGWPLMTIRRGEIAYENGEVIASKGSGRLISRKRIGLQAETWDLPLL